MQKKPFPRMFRVVVFTPKKERKSKKKKKKEKRIDEERKLFNHQRIVSTNTCR